MVKLVKENGTVYATSREIALNFEKEHGSIIKLIEGENRKGEHLEGLLEQIQSSGNPQDYFIATKYTDSKNRTYTEYKLTKDGFALLAMGFTGAKALKFKLEYINKFNEMELALKQVSDVMTVKGEMSLEDWNVIRFASKKTINTFADCRKEELEKLVNEFEEHCKTLDTETRIARCNSAIKGLERAHDNLAKESVSNIGDCYNINLLIRRVKEIAHITENRRNGGLKSSMTKKIRELEKVAL